MVVDRAELSRSRVLVVDDEPPVRDLIGAVLAADRIESEAAADAHEARARLGQGGIDLMLLDLMLPGVDGFTFLEQLQHQPRLRPSAILVVSAKAAREDILRALELGANDYITKPFDVDDLLVRVEMWLSRNRADAEEERRLQEQNALRIHTFGLLRVQQGEVPLVDESFRYRKARALLKYLITHYGQRIARERLLELLWPDLDEEAGANNLHGTVHLLRRVLEADRKERYIVHTGGLVYFNTDAPHWWDVRAFREHLERAAAAEQRDDVDLALTEYASAIALYIGDYLEEDLYEDWSVPTREALREEWLSALARVASLRAGREEYDEAISLLKRVQREDPFREQTYRDLMSYLYRAGRRPEAVQLFRSAEQLFRDELGIEPMQATRDVYERVVRGEPV